MSTIPFITFDAAEKLVKLAFTKGITPYLKGSPSSGKTAIGFKVAKQANLVPIVFSLMDHDPTDLSGLPDLSGEKACFKPFNTFPLSTDPIPQGKNGWLIMLDEFASGTAAMQAAANKLIYERLVGTHKLHPKAFVMAMGNLATDNAFVIEEPAHTKSRAMQLYVQQDVHEWLDWAIKHGIDSRVLGYVEMKPLSITTYDPDHVGINYPCARTMEMASQLLKGEEQIERWILPALQGVLGEGAGLELYNFCILRNELPTIKQVLADPEHTPVPSKANYRYAMACMVADYFTAEHAETLLKYVVRLPEDNQYFLMRNAIHRDSSILLQPAVRQWTQPFVQKYMRT